MFPHKFSLWSNLLLGWIYYCRWMKGSQQIGWKCSCISCSYWSFNLLYLMNEIAVGGVVKSAVSGFQENIYRTRTHVACSSQLQWKVSWVCVCVCGNKETITIGYGDQNASHTCVLYAQFCGRRQNGCVWWSHALTGFDTY